MNGFDVSVYAIRRELDGADRSRSAGGRRAVSRSKSFITGRPGPPGLGRRGYAGKLVSWAAAALRLKIQIVKRPDDLHTFQVLPRRWVVERTFAWISKFRRTVRDYERLPEQHEAIIQWAMIAVMARRLARQAAQPSAA